MSALNVLTLVILGLYTLHCTLLIAAAWYFFITRGSFKLLTKAALSPLFKYTALVPLNIAATYAAMILAPLFAALARPNGWLPWWLKWASTHDEWLYGMATQIGTEPIATKLLGRYWQRVRWIWRNPAYHFAHYVCGYKARRGVASRTADVQNAVIVGNRAEDTPMFAVAPWGNAFYVEPVLLGFRFGLGWKLWRTDAQDPDGICMMACKIKRVK